VLNNSGPVSDAVRNRVQDAVRQHGYIHNASKRPGSSQGLRGGSAVILLYRPGPIEILAEGADGVQVMAPAQVDSKRGVVTSLQQLSNGFFHLVFEGILEESNHWDVRTSLQTCSELDAEAVTRRMKNDDASALLFVGPYRPELESFIAEFSAPMVLAGTNYRSQHDAITIDNHDGIRQAVKHLAELGHRKIGFVGVNDMPDFEERRLAFLANMHVLGLPIREEWISLGSLQMAEITERTSALLSRSERPTALVCGNDLTAISTIEAAKRSGIRVPDELSVVGFDDIPVAMLNSPQLTTVRVPVQQIGRQSVRQLVIRDSCQEGIPYEGCVARVATRLIVRHSTAPPVEQ